MQEVKDKEMRDVGGKKWEVRDVGRDKRSKKLRRL